MTMVGKELIESAGEALAIAQGRLQPAKVIAPEVIDVATIRKRLDRQKEGKKRMRHFGKVEIPQEAFIEALKMGD